MALRCSKPEAGPILKAGYTILARSAPITTETNRTCSNSTNIRQKTNARRPGGGTRVTGRQCAHRIVRTRSSAFCALRGARLHLARPLHLRSAHWKRSTCRPRGACVPSGLRIDTNTVPVVSSPSAAASVTITRTFSPAPSRRRAASSERTSAELARSWLSAQVLQPPHTFLCCLSCGARSPTVAIRCLRPLRQRLQTPAHGAWRALTMSVIAWSLLG